MLNPCGTWAAAGELSNGVQAAALPVPTTYIGCDGERRLREPSSRVCVLIVEGCNLPVAIPSGSSAPPRTSPRMLRLTHDLASSL